jgi:tripartite-type tricarboxylate transporter receptor subunit TctC
MIINVMKHSMTLLMGAISLIVCNAQAQSNYPNRPIKLIVPYATGGGSDILARTVGSKLQALWGQGISD